MQCVRFLFFLTQIRKTDVTLIKNEGQVFFSNISIVASSVGLPMAVNNPVPTSHVGFKKFRAIQRFCVEGSNKHSDRGHSSNDLELLTDRTFRQARNQLGTPGGAKSFPRGAKFFLNYVQYFYTVSSTFFQMRRKFF